MKLRQKLLTTFTGLGVLALLNAGVTLWAISQWQASNQKLNDHYQRSLLVKSLQSQIFRGLKEIPDAITGGDRNAEEEFEASLKSVEEDFSNWEKLAYTDEEKKQVQQIRNAYGSLRDNTEDIFQLIAKNRSSEAINLMEEQLDAKNFPRRKS